MNCLKNQRTELILNSVSENFHERAARVRNGSLVNLTASAECPPKAKGVNIPVSKGDFKASQLELDSSTQNTITMNNELPPKPSTAKFGMNGAPTDQAHDGSLGLLKPTMLHTQEKIDPRLQRRPHEIYGLRTSEPRLSPASTPHVKYPVLFGSVVYPAMKKSKKRHKDSLPSEELDAIGKTVSLTSMSKWKNRYTDPLDYQRYPEKIGFSLRGFRPAGRGYKKENKALREEVVSSKGQES